MTERKTPLEKDGKSARPQDAHLLERRADQAQREKSSCGEEQRQCRPGRQYPPKYA